MSTKPAVIEPTGLYYLLAEERHMHILDRKLLDNPDE